MCFKNHSQNHSIRVAKPFNLQCKTIRSQMQNHLIGDTKSFKSTLCKTIRSMMQSNLIHVVKPINP